MPLQSPSLKALQVVTAELRQLFKSGMRTPLMLSVSQIQKKEINPALRSLLAGASMTPCHLNLQEASQIDALLINISAAEELCTVWLPQLLTLVQRLLCKGTNGHQNSLVACYAPLCFAVKERLALSEKPAFHVPVLLTAQR